MRLYRSLRPVMLLGMAAAGLEGQTLISLGASSPGSSSGCALTGGQTCTLTARVTGLSNATVTFSFNPTVANATLGPVTGPDATGLSSITYKAPNLIAARQTVTATATAADGTRAVTLITLVPPTVTLQVTPSAVTLGPGASQKFSAAVFGTSQTGVTWSLNPAVGTIDAGGLYTAPSTIASTQKISIVATSIFDPNASGSASVTLEAPSAISVTVAPATVSLSNAQTQQFTATVQNAPSNAVTWSISPQNGTIDASGLYTAPALINTSSKVTVTAVSVADASKSGTATITLGPLLDVGAGAPTPALQQQFVTAFYRNGFSTLVSLPPVANVKTLGSTGYVQEFNDKVSGAKLALVTASPTVGSDPAGRLIAVVQLLADLYAYYTSVGVNTAGYPLTDTQACPAFDAANSCQYDLFDKGYALFAYSAPLAAGQNFAINGGFYTKWSALGGMGGPGRPVTGQASITSSSGVAATAQTFAQGAIFNVTSGTHTGTFGVIEPLYDLYAAESGPLGRLGLPISDVLEVSQGVRVQKFEGGDLQYTSSGGPAVRLPVTSVTLSGAAANATINLNLGQSVTVTATPVVSNGENAPDRPVSWSSTNGKVIAIQANGATATLTAVGGGSASVTASSQGISSPRISFLVIAPCCQIGEGAPAGVGQSFRDALLRNKIEAKIPLPSPAVRAGSGYVQMVQANDGRGTIYMVAQSDSLGTAYVIGGSILSRYQTLGGPAGALGYPTADASASGTQTFAFGALSGIPVRLVSGPVLAKWASMGYDAGPAGYPLSDASPFFTFGANSGMAQSFGRGAIFGATAGPRGGQAFFVSGPILARYAALGGASGDFGMPISDEFSDSGARRQNFEGGNITYGPGDSAAVEHPAAKVPAIIVSPSTVSAGGRARLAIAGFPNNSRIRVSLTGQPDFEVAAATGAYSWEMAVPASARSGVIAIHASDNSGAAADGVLTIRGFSEQRLQIAKIQGDNQTGLPGALLPQPLRAALADNSGAPIVGARLSFVPSPGVQLSAASAVTDSAGRAEVRARLPLAEGIAAVTVESPSVAQSPTTFYARSAAASLTNFPRLSQAGGDPLGNGGATIAQKGALVAAVASILRYGQNRGELPAPNGLADPATLNQFLKAYCSVDLKGARLCDGFLSNPDSGEQVVNLWRAAEFTGGVDVSVQPATTAAIADLLGAGVPALLSLALSKNGTPAGGHFVVAIGVAPDGGILIHDPNPVFARANLAEYLAGFAAAGATWKAELRGVARLSAAVPAPSRFLLAALSQPETLVKNLGMEIQSAAGTCGLPLDLFDAVDSSGAAPARGPLLSRILLCDGSNSTYQITIGAPQPFRALLTDLAAAGSSTDLSGAALSTYHVTRSPSALVIEPLTLTVSPNGIVDAATFTGGIAPGGLAAIFGAGLSGPGAATAVDFDGVPAVVLAATPFQLNVEVPPSLASGDHTVRIRSAYGTAQQTVTVSAVAPRIFLIGNPAVAAVVNHDYTLNSLINPAIRGLPIIIYATGLGAVRPEGDLSVAQAPVTVLLDGQRLPAAFAGLTPGFLGLYQVNVVIPTFTAPGLGISLTLQQGEETGNTISVALQ